MSGIRGKRGESHLTLPLEKTVGMNPFSVDAAARSILEQARRYMVEEMALTELESDAVKMTLQRRPLLRDKTVLISIRGSANGTFALSVDADLARYFAHKMILEPLPPEEEETLNGDVLCEIANVIVGNSLGTVLESDQSVTLGAPELIVARQTVMESMGGEVWAAQIATDQGEYCINLTSCSLT